MQLESKTPEAFEEEWVDLVGAFIIGDKLQDDAFCDAIIDSMIAKSNAPFEGFHHFLFFKHATRFVYKYTPETSPLRKLMIDQHVYHGADNWYANAALEDVDKSFLRDLSVALMGTRPKPSEEAPYRSGSNCRYHKHGEDVPCYQARYSQDS